jgi:hypothetical protein
VGVVDQAVEDGIGDGGIADDLVPAIDRDLAGDDDRAGLVAVLDDFQEVAALLGVEWLRPPVVEDQQVEAGQGAQRPGIAAVSPSTSNPDISHLHCDRRDFGGRRVAGFCGRARRWPRPAAMSGWR